MTSNTRNGTLDVMRLICAACVIAIHWINMIPTVGGKFLKPSLSIAVPFFFMLSGYYYGSLSEKKRKAQTRKILRLIITASLLYGGVRIVSRLSSSDDLTRYLTQLRAMDTWINLFLWNESPFSGHLWYLHAFLYVLIIVWIVERKWDRRVLYPLIPILLFGNVILGRYSMLLLRTEFPKYIYRNYIFLGLPYFLFGDFLKQGEHKVTKKGSLAGILLFTLTTYVEAAILGQWDMYFFSTPLLMFSLFKYIEMRPRGGDVFLKLSLIGRRYAGVVYIVHPLFIEVFNRFIPGNLLDDNFAGCCIFFILIPLVLLCSIVAAQLLLKIQATVRNFHTN